MDNNIPDDLISPTKAAQILKVHVASVYRWILAGRLRAWTRASTRHLVSEADVRALLQPAVPRPRPPVVVQPSQAAEAQRRRTEEVLRAAGYRV
jgi:excisionase family DNA binding protein